ncbi:NADH-quinone oxidoreductase subunit NuoK [Nonomuraea longicatena]|uniref:NADH-quinone oxidoreductase subunit K n=1 Tax=Nonomuraea longicatena TaxID=83682 RepID=A0ABN1Q633_9ACTN
MHIVYPAIVSALLFSIGVYGVLARRNTILVLMSVELMLNAVNINLVAFDVWLGDRLHSGQVLTLFVIVIAAAEVGLGLAIVLALFRNRQTVDIDHLRTLAEPNDHAPVDGALTPARVGVGSSAGGTARAHSGQYGPTGGEKGAPPVETGRSGTDLDDRAGRGQGPADQTAAGTPRGEVAAAGTLKGEVAAAGPKGEVAAIGASEGEADDAPEGRQAKDAGPEPGKDASEGGTGRASGEGRPENTDRRGGTA